MAQSTHRKGKKRRRRRPKNPVVRFLLRYRRCFYLLFAIGLIVFLICFGVSSCKKKQAEKKAESGSSSEEVMNASETSSETESDTSSESESGETNTENPSAGLDLSELDPLSMTESETGEAPTEPETPATEPPAETEAPVTEPPTEAEAPPVVETPPAATVSVAPAVTADIGTVHAISQDEINQIRANYDCNARGFSGRNFMDSARGIQATLDAQGLNARMVTGTENAISFVFMEGWENGYTNQLLDILASKGVKAGFYMHKEFAANNPALVQRMIAEGHVVGSHGSGFFSDGTASQPLEVIQSDAMILQQYMRDTYGYEMTTYNFSSAVWSPGAVALLNRMGYKVIMNVYSYADFSASSYIDPNTSLQDCISVMQPGMTYGFHVTNPVTVQFIGSLIDYAISQGYQIAITP